MLGQIIFGEIFFSANKFSANLCGCCKIIWIHFKNCSFFFGQVNEPDLVLFVGEALVGNEAVDQLVKFNQALADYSDSANPHIIDGIVLTKFDTIDDKVGAAISMTYITGQPIVFVGTGQTYTDLKALNAKAVVQALMKWVQQRIIYEESSVSSYIWDESRLFNNIYCLTNYFFERFFYFCRKQRGTGLWIFVSIALFAHSLQNIKIISC